MMFLLMMGYGDCWEGDSEEFSNEDCDGHYFVPCQEKELEFGNGHKQCDLDVISTGSK